MKPGLAAGASEIRLGEAGIGRPGFAGTAHTVAIVAAVGVVEVRCTQA
jgi:hypothetical protein